MEASQVDVHSLTAVSKKTMLEASTYATLLLPPFDRVPFKAAVPELVADIAGGGLRVSSSLFRAGCLTASLKTTPLNCTDMM